MGEEVETLTPNDARAVIRALDAETARPSQPRFPNIMWLLKALISAPALDAPDAPDDVSLTTPIKSLDRFQSFLKHRNVYKYQKSILRVYKGAFGISNRETGRFILGQTSAYPASGRRALEPLEIPYFPQPHSLRAATDTAPEEDNETEAYQELVDYLFIQRRDDQMLAPKVGQGMAPEFYWRLLRSGDQELLPSPPFCRTMREKFQCIYCAEGETTYFLMAWRLLMRYCQANSSGLMLGFRPGNIDLKEALRAPAHWASRYEDISPWSSKLWEAAGLTLEASWLESLRTLETDENTLEGRSRIFAIRVRKQWAHWRRLLDDVPKDSSGAPSHPYLADWINTGLIYRLPPGKLTSDTPVRIRPGLRAWVRYMCYLASGHSTQQGSKESVREVQERLSDFNSRIKDVTECPFGHLIELDTAFQELTLALFRFMREDEGPPLTRDLLCALHSAARFPIIPYFYWIAADGKPKGHLVFPIWSSHRFPVKVRIPRRGTSPAEILRRAYRDDLEEVSTPIVGVCLMGIAPLERSDWSLTGYGLHEALGESAQRRLRFIMLFYEQLARPLIDEGLYGSIVAGRIIQQAQEGQRADAAAGLLHNLRNLVAPALAVPLRIQEAFLEWLGNPENRIIDDYYDGEFQKFWNDQVQPEAMELLIDWRKIFREKVEKISLLFNERASAEMVRRTIDAFYWYLTREEYSHEKRESLREMLAFVITAISETWTSTLWEPTDDLHLRQGVSHADWVVRKAELRLARRTVIEGVMERVQKDENGILWLIPNRVAITWSVSGTEWLIPYPSIAFHILYELTWNGVKYLASEAILHRRAKSEPMLISIEILQCKDAVSILYTQHGDGQALELVRTALVGSLSAATDEMPEMSGIRGLGSMVQRCQWELRCLSDDAKLRVELVIPIPDSRSKTDER